MIQYLSPLQLVNPPVPPKAGRLLFAGGTPAADVVELRQKGSQSLPLTPKELLMVDLEQFLLELESIGQQLTETPAAQLNEKVLSSIWEVHIPQHNERWIAYGEEDRKLETITGYLEHTFRNRIQSLRGDLYNYQFRLTPESTRTEIQKRIPQTIQSFQALIRDFLSGLQAGITGDQRSIVHTLGSILDTLQPEIQKKKLHLSVKGLEHPIIANQMPDMSSICLYFVLENLIQNAMKYTPDNGTLKIRFRPSPDGKNVLCSIEDSGIGIPKAEQQKVFHGGYRASNAITSGIYGCGHGLKLAQNMLEVIESELRIKSPVKQESPHPGTKIRFRLPLASG